MDSSSRNIYKTARQTPGMTQERWAELIGVSADSVRLYESGRGLPSDEVVARMAEIAPMPVLGYWHLKHKSGIANDLLPDVAQVSLPQAVVQLLVAIRDFKESTDDLLVIAADGIVDRQETSVFEDILESLDGIIKAALAVKYAGGSRHD